VPVVVRGFGPGDLVAGIFGFAQQRNGYMFQSRTLLPEGSDGFMKRLVNLFGNHFKEKVLWQTKTKTLARRSFCGPAQKRLFFAAHKNWIEEQSGVRGATRQGADAIETGR
jgi:hypothetical protein